MDKRDKLYKPDELPKEITRTVYLHYKIGGYFAGQINIWDWDKPTDSDSIVICGAEVTVKIPNINKKTLKKKAIETLEQEKEKIMAENHQRLKVVQDKIDNLLAIEYQPDKGE